MKILQRFQALRPAIQFILHEMDQMLKGRRMKLHWVFDIDDTIIFDNARSTPNAQILDLVRMAKGRGDHVHLVTARTTGMKSETIAELGRVGVP